MKALGLATALLAVSCAGAVAAEAVVLPPGRDGLAAWRRARADLDGLRRRVRHDAPYRMQVAIAMRHPLTGAIMRARGAIAVAAPDALRMILLGPGGTTALDVWICRDDYELVVPAADLERRGSTADPPDTQRGLPVAFLRYWFLRPFSGTLLFATEARRFALRDGEAVVSLTASAEHDGGVLLERRAATGDERIDWDGRECGTVTYEQRSTGLYLEATCSDLDAAADVPPEAFADPDDPERLCVGGATP